MKAVLIFFFGIAISVSCKAQFPDKTLIRVKYTLSHIRDTLNRNEPYKEQMMLLLGKNVSLFTSLDKIVQLKKLRDYVNEQAAQNGGNLIYFEIKPGMRRPVTNTDFYTVANEKKVYVVDMMMMNKYIYDDTISNINWKLTNDTANLSGISCRKAKAYFKGRNWNVWYAPEIAFPNGPWKLNGLPGLIIMAWDDRKDIEFSFDGIEKVDESNIENKDQKVRLSENGIEAGLAFYLGGEIILPSNAIKTTRDQLLRLREAMANNPSAAMSQQLNGNATITRISPPSAPTTKKAFNNPIELPEVK